MLTRSRTGLQAIASIFVVPAFILMLAARGVAAPQTSPGDQSPPQPPTPPPTDPMKVDVTVFGTAEPAKTDVNLDARSLPASVTVLQDAEIRRKTFREPSEILRSMPGVDVAIYGQGGVPGGLSVRGYTDRNFGQDIAGHLDGIPLNIFGFVASHGALDLTPIFTDAVERIELVRGPLDARYGDFNRGASVNFVTRDGVDRPSISIGTGSFGSLRLAGTYGNGAASAGRPSVYTSFDASTTGGYADNQGLKSFRTFHKVRVPFGRSDLSLALLTFWSRWDAPSYLSLNALNAGTTAVTAAVNPTDGGNQDNELVYARYRHLGGTPNELAVTGYVGHMTWQRYRSDFLISPTQTQVHQVDQRTRLGYRAEKAFGGLLATRRSQFVVGSTLHHDDAATQQDNTVRRSLLRATDDVPERLTSFGLYAQEQWQPVPRLKLMGGARYSSVHYDIDDRLRAPGTFVSSYSTSQVSPKVAVAFSPVRDVDVYGNVGTGMRSPTPRTEVRNSIDSVASVQIAETKSYEIGVKALLLHRLDVRADRWRADNSNEIRGIPPGGTQFESLGASRRNGTEVEFRGIIGPVTRAFTSFSWVDATLTTPTTAGAVYLPDIPASVYQIGFESGIPVRNLPAGALMVSADLSFYGEKYLNATGTLKAETYQRVTFRAVYEHHRRYRLWLGGFAYPGSKFGESEFLFGSTIGVRPNPGLSVDTGLTYIF